MLVGSIQIFINEIYFPRDVAKLKLVTFICIHLQMLKERLVDKKKWS